MNQDKQKLVRLLMDLKREEYPSYMKIILNCIGIKHVLEALVKCLEEMDADAGGTTEYFLVLRKNLEKTLEEYDKRYADEMK